MKLLRKLRLGGGGNKNKKYLQIGVIGLTVIALAWFAPKLIRQKEQNQAASIPASAAVPAPIAAGLGPISAANGGLSPYSPSLQSSYRVARVGISPYRQRILT